MRTRNKITTMKLTSSLNSAIARRALALGVVALVALGALSACDDRGGAVFTVETEEGNPTWINNHAFVESQFSQLEDLPTTWLRVYTPPGETPQLGLTRPYPVLYLLSPFEGDHFFYFHHGVAEVMDRMIASGEIEPYIVVCINGSANAFGGSFYSDHITAGQFQNLVTPAAWSYIDTLFYTLPGADFRAISGYEMGGYGAFRCALTPDTLSNGVGTGLPAFGSVSAISAPLNFTDAANGFPALFTQALAEWGSYSDIDTSAAAPITNFVIAASAGFTPEDTAYTPNPIPFWLDVFGWPTFTVDSINKIYDSSVIDSTFIFEADTFLTVNTIDTTLEVETKNISIDTTVLSADSTFLFDTTATIIDTTIDTIPIPPDTLIDTSYIVDTSVTLIDTTSIDIDTSHTHNYFETYDTLFDSLFVDDTLTFYNPPTDLVFQTFPDIHTMQDDKLRIFLPFDENGDTYAPIWSNWARHDVWTMFDNAPAEMHTALSGNTLIMTTPTAPYGHYQQSRDFAAHMKSSSVLTEYIEYTGYSGFADDGSRYLYEVWPTILKFHSDKFHDKLPVELQAANYVTQF